jgi:hypothetical protein
MFFDQLPESEPFVQLADENEPAIRGHTRTLEIDLQRPVERQLKGLALFFTHWVLASSSLSMRSNPHR